MSNIKRLFVSGFMFFVCPTLALAQPEYICVSETSGKRFEFYVLEGEIDIFDSNGQSLETQTDLIADYTYFNVFPPRTITKLNNNQDELISIISTSPQRGVVIYYYPDHDSTLNCIIPVTYDDPKGNIFAYGHKTIR